MPNVNFFPAEKQVDYDQLSRVMTPDNSETHFPIPHSMLVNNVQTALMERDMEIIHTQHSLTADGNRYFGIMQVRSGMDDYDMAIGLRNSHDKTFAAGLVLGSAVFVCENLAFSGEIRFARSHTRYIIRDLPGIVAQGLGTLAEKRIEQAQRIERYKNTQLSPQQADHIIVQMARENIVAGGNITKVVKEWDSPSHPEFAAEGRSVWRMFNAVTEVSKSAPNALINRTTRLHGLMDHYCEPKLTLVEAA